MKAYKNRHLTTSGMTALISCFLLFSCNNDDLLDNGNNGHTGESCDYICFGMSPGENVPTRGNAGNNGSGYTSDRFVLRAGDSADTLCVRAVVSDGIDGSAFEGETPVTRSAPVSELSTYGSFHVLAYWKKGGMLVEEQFYMDEDVTEQGSNLWSSTNTYYWPGTGHTFQFYAWAPVDAANLTTPSSPTVTTLEYTVPDDVSEQKDILVATTAETAGNYNSTLPLSFRHICTAVKFTTGSQMQPGTIKNVALKGVRNSGTYDMATDSWTLDAATGDFSQSLEKIMSGSETSGSEITTEEGTFMMLPQTLPANAMIEVVFNDGTTGTERTFTAPVAATEWPQGKTVTYRLSISPEYNMSIDCEDKVDAHYVIQEIQIKADCDWTLASDVEWLTFTDYSYDTSNPANRPLGLNGYWIRSERGTQTFSGSGDKTLYAYYDENAGENNREAKLTLSYAGNGRSADGNTKTITQYCPAWSGDAGYERFEEDDNTYPFGFAWDRNVTFTARPALSIGQGNFFTQLFGAYVFDYIADDIITEYSASDYITVTHTTRDIFFVTWITSTSVTIDYSKINSIESGQISNSDGLSNTRYLYNVNSAGQVSTIENRLRDNAVGNFTETVTKDTYGDTPIDQFAVRMIAKKNEFQKRQRTSDDGSITYWEAYIESDNIHWYLPASIEQNALSNGLVEGVDTPLEGTYWSSTATSDNVNSQAYMYDANGNLTPAHRMDTHKIRAVRKKP